jgi:hypothetical protein
MRAIILAPALAISGCSGLMVLGCGGAVGMDPGLTADGGEGGAPVWGAELEPFCTTLEAGAWVRVACAGWCFETARFGIMCWPSADECRAWRSAEGEREPTACTDYR